MKRHFDKTALLGVSALAGAFLVLVATGDRLVAIIGAAGSIAMTALLMRTWKTGPGARREEKRSRMIRARALIESFAVNPDPSAIKAILHARYGPGNYSLALIPIHPLGPALNACQILGAYREHIGQDQLLICCTGPVSAQARAAAQELRNPVLKILDGESLIRIAAEGKTDLPPAEKAKKRHLRIRLERRRAPAVLAYALLMLGMYIILGIRLHLFMSIALGILGAACLQKPRTPQSLWE